MVSPYGSGFLNKLDDYRWEIPQSYKPGMRVPGLIYVDEAMLSHIEGEQALEQVADVGASRVPKCLTPDYI